MKKKCKRCNKNIPDTEYDNDTGTGFCYNCWVNHREECEKLKSSSKDNEGS